MLLRGFCAVGFRRCMAPCLCVSNNITRNRLLLQKYCGRRAGGSAGSQLCRCEALLAPKLLPGLARLHDHPATPPDCRNHAAEARGKSSQRCLLLKGSSLASAASARLLLFGAASGGSCFLCFCSRAWFPCSRVLGVGVDAAS